MPHYGSREAQTMALMVLEDVFGVSVVDVYADKVRHFSEEEIKRLENIYISLHSGNEDLSFRNSEMQAVGDE